MERYSAIIEDKLNKYEFTYLEFKTAGIWILRFKYIIYSKNKQEAGLGMVVNMCL
jgi:hypothetical protein